MCVECGFLEGTDFDSSCTAVLVCDAILGGNGGSGSGGC